MAAAQENYPLEYTPTWTVAVVCSVFVIVSLGLQRGIHRLKKNLQKRSQKALCESLEKLKEELMLLGFISLLLTVFQGPINHICIPKRYTRYMLPCRRTEAKNAIAEGLGLESESHARKLFSLLGSTRRVLSEGTDAGHCQKKGKAPFLSTEGLHHLHIFIFVLAIVHVVYGGLTMLLGIAKIRTWKRWEDEIRENKYNTKDGLKRRFTYGARDDFVKSYSEGPTRESIVQSWMVSLCKQFYGSVTKSDYGTLRGGFIQWLSLGVCGDLLAP